MRYDIKRGSAIVANVRPESGEQRKEVMLTDMVSMIFNTNEAVDFLHGDHVEVWGETYYLNTLPEMDKQSSVKFKYNLVFQAAWYDLAKPLFHFYDEVNTLWSLSEFSLMGTAETALALIVANANRDQSGWVVGDVEPTITKELHFTGEETVLQALTQIAQEFETEWWIVGKVIHLKKKGDVSGLHLEYGRDKGLRGGLRRTNVDASGAFSRLYVRGSSQNLPFNYRNGQNRLMLPTLPYIQGPKYGQHEIERSVTFDDIKPERIGTVTAVGDKFTFTDTGIDFDINDILYPGLSAKITFQTGHCAGYEFEVAKGGYDHPTKTITLLPVDEEKAIEMPSDVLKPAIGDKYVLSDIKMPDEYVDDAEQRLKLKGEEYFALNSPPKVSYEVPPDYFYFDRNSTVLTLGDYVFISDTDIGINKSIRVTAISRSLHDEFRYNSMTISDIVKGQIINGQFNKAEKQAKAIAANRISDMQRARRNWKTTSELSTLLNTIKAEMLLITMDGGAYSSNLVATVGVNDISITAGRIVHEQYTDGNGIWNVAAFNGIGELDENKPYYVYIKAGRATGTAVIHLSLTKLAVEADPAFYYFPFGVVSSIIDGGRLFTTLRGYTRVTGDTITLGRINANDSQNYFDLNSGQFNLGDDDSGMDWSVSADGKLTIRGEIVATGASFVNLIVQNLRTAPGGHKRVEIDAARNNIRLYDSDDNVLVAIDDNVALVGYLPAPDPLDPPTPVYGPGIMIGNEADDFLSLGITGVRTNGSVDARHANFEENVSAKSYASVISIASGSLPNQGTVMANANCSLYTTPRAGQRQVVKNVTGGNITVAADTTLGRKILNDLNAMVDSITLASGGVCGFEYYKQGDYWVMI